MSEDSSWSHDGARKVVRADSTLHKGPKLFLSLCLALAMNMVVGTLFLTTFSPLASAHAAAEDPSAGPLLQQRPIVDPHRAHLLPSSLTTAHFKDGRLVVFALGSDNRVYQVHQVSATMGQGWSAQQVIGSVAPVALTGTLTSALDAAQQTVVFALGNDQQIYALTQSGQTESWGAWQKVGKPASKLQGNPVVGQLSDGRLSVFVIGTDHVLYQANQCASGCTWGGFAPLAQQQSPTLIGTPAITKTRNGSLVVAAIGADNKLHYTTSGGAAWTILAPPQGVQLQGTPQLIADDAQHAAELLVAGRDNSIYSTTVQTGSASPLAKLGQIPQALHGTVVVRAIRAQTGVTALFAQDSQGSIFTADEHSASQLSSWTQLSRTKSGLQGNLTLTLARNGQPEAFVLDANYQVQSTFQHPVQTRGKQIVASANVSGQSPGAALTYGAFVPLTALTTTAANGLGQTNFYGYYTHRIDDHVQLQVNVGSGNLIVNVSELTIRGTGLDLSVEHTYNSLSNSWSPYGQNWGLNFGYNVNIHGNDDGSETYFDASGHPWTFTSDGAGNWVTPPGLDADLVYHDDISQEVLTYRKTGLVYTFTTDQTILQKITDKNGNTITFNVDASLNSQIDSITDTQGRTTTLGYDVSGSGILSQITDPSLPTARTVQYGYDGNNNLTSVTDLNGKLTTFGYTGGLLTSITDPLLHVTTIAYNSNGLVASVSDATTIHAQTTFAYYSNGASVCSGLVSAGQSCGVVTDANNHQTTYAYDSNFLVAAVKDAKGNKTSKTYTTDYNVQSYTDALTNLSSFTFSTDGRNNLQSINDGSGAITQFGYPVAGDPLQYYPNSVTDAQNNQTSVQYDTKGNATSAQDSTAGGTGIKVAYTYNSNGTVATEKDGKNNQTSFGYDSHGNLTSVTFPSPLHAQSLTIDGLSRVSSLTDGNNHKTIFTYDKLDRVTKITYADNSTIVYVYDNNGNVTSVTDHTGVTSFTYDQDNRQTVKTLPSTAHINTSFDPVGNLLSLSASGTTINYAYNEVNLLITLTEPGSAQTHFNYDNAYRRTQTSYPNGVTMNMTYDGAGHLLTIVGKHGSTTLTSYTYTYANGSNHTSLRQSVTDLANKVTSYSYDTLNRLTSALLKNSGGTQTDKYAYQYDLASNISQIAHGLSSPTTTTFNYNAANELTSSTGVASYSYDNNGNLTGWTGGPSINYNDQNQTTAIGSNTFNYTGPDQNERVQVNSTTFVYSGLGLNATGNTYYTRDNRGQLIDERTSSGTYYYLFDGLGSIVGLTDSSGNLVNNETYQYDPYGNLKTAVSSSVLQNNPWRYASGYFDSGTGLYKYGIRYYMPTTGRWTQRDPVGGSLAETTKVNPYVYADDDPVNLVDPGGRDDIWSQAWSDAQQATNQVFVDNTTTLGIATGIGGIAALATLASPPAGVVIAAIGGGIAAVVTAEALGAGAAYLAVAAFAWVIGA